MGIEQNDPAAIDSLLRQQEVSVDQVLKVFRTIRFLIFTFHLKFYLDFGPFYESLKHENHQPCGIHAGFVGCKKVCAGCHAALCYSKVVDRQHKRYS